MKKITVIGGANIDIQGVPEGKLALRESNIGTIRYSFGGVGRNVAENLCLLHDPVQFISAFGNDAFGIDMKRYCASVGMDLGHSISCEHNSSIYLAVLDENRDMYTAVNDMRILEHITPSVVSQALNEMSEQDILVLDTNLTEETIDYCMNHAHSPVCVDPISVHKADRIRPYLSRLDVFKPNRYEAEYLSGISIDSPDGLQKNLRFFLDQGVKHIVISLGEQGIAAAEKSGAFHLRHTYTPMVNATGAGDSFVAGLIHGLAHEYSLEQACQYAAGCAVLTVQSAFTVSEYMAPEAVEKTLENMQFTIQRLSV